MSSFEQLISNPLGILGLPGAKYFSTVCSTTNFSVNLAFFIFDSALVVFMVYNVAMGIYKVATSEEKEIFQKLHACITNVVYIAVSLGLISVVAFVPANVLRITGVKDADNIFVNNACGSGSILPVAVIPVIPGVPVPPVAPAPVVPIPVTALPGGPILPPDSAADDSVGVSPLVTPKPLTEQCGRLLNVGVSVDGSSPSAEITIPKNYKKYYVHIIDSEKKGGQCSTLFAIKSGNGNTMDKWETQNWGPYRSDNNGIARIDFTSLPVGKYVASFKPYNEAVGFSNTVTVNIVDVITSIVPDHSSVKYLSHISPGSRFTQILGKKNTIMTIAANINDGAASSTINGEDYFPHMPGYTYMYTTYNNQANVVATTRLQLEEETDWCGFKVIPWLFQKNDAYAYWNPQVKNASGQNIYIDKNARWYVAAPDYSYTQSTNYNNYVWAVGFKQYVRSNFQDVGTYVNYYAFQSTANVLPAYALIPKKANVPTSYLSLNSIFKSEGDETTCPTLNAAGQTSKDDWHIRIDKSNINLSDNGYPGKFTYSGNAYE